MIRACPTCGDYDDEFRTTVCPHRPFAANDGNNAFEIRNSSVGPYSGGDNCPRCSSPVNTGFGLAGGGFGAYVYCSSEKCNYFEKFPEGDA